MPLIPTIQVAVNSKGPVAVQARAIVAAQGASRSDLERLRPDADDDGAAAASGGLRAILSPGPESKGYGDLRSVAITPDGAYALYSSLMETVVFDLKVCLFSASFSFLKDDDAFGGERGV